MFDGPDGAAAAAAAGKCYWSQWKDDRGGGWWERRVHQRVTWCASSSTGKLTSWGVIDWPDHGLMCDVSWGPESFRVSGGVGATFVEVKTHGSFTCTLPFPPNPTDWIEVDVRYHADGRREDV